ncbi:MAG: hypothetical protein CENE_02040 [Candidatus Celerinatantimonas neptuna]|nr:MAG: hypothetical protein CENE_02040 [Candidatus Celerinatantimonas neptuna]
MKPYLVFRLYGPMASWGLPAVGGDRHTAMAPSRSAILGLLGAALGIRRDDSVQLLALQNSVQIAVKQLVQGILVRDYHTTQVPSANKKVVHRTRKSELSESQLNTVLSSRDYRCDGMWVVAVSLVDQACITLEALHSALLKPAFQLYLGRKTCPLAAPLMPQLLTPCDLRSALDTVFPALTGQQKSDQRCLRFNQWVTYYWQGEQNELFIDDHATVLTSQIWDEPQSRARWQFTTRTMHQVSLKQDSLMATTAVGE